MLNYPKVAIVYLSYHCELYLERALEALKNTNYPKDKLTIIIVDNLHPNYGNSREFIQNIIQNDADLPRIIFLPQEKNLGYAGGNNTGVKWAVENGYDYVYFHNQDGFLAPDGILKITETMESNKYIGAAQSLIMLYPEQDLINTSGNKFHYLGFGFCGEYRKPAHSAQTAVRSIGYASGAGMMARVDLLRQWGGFDEDFFAYHEDLEYSLRLKALGYKIVLAAESVFYHEYEFSRNPGKYYFMERNRLGILLMYYKGRTLALFLPIWFLLKIGLGFVSLRNGWAKEYVKVFGYWFKPGNWKPWLRKRELVQKTRKISDRELLSAATGKIEFEGMNGWLVDAGNLILNGCWGLIRKIIVW